MGEDRQGTGGRGGGERKEAVVVGVAVAEGAERGRGVGEEVAARHSTRIIPLGRLDPLSATRLRCRCAKVAGLNQLPDKQGWLLATGASTVQKNTTQYSKYPPNRARWRQRPLPPAGVPSRTWQKKREERDGERRLAREPAGPSTLPPRAPRLPPPLSLLRTARVCPCTHRVERGAPVWRRPWSPVGRAPPITGLDTGAARRRRRGGGPPASALPASSAGHGVAARYHSRVGRWRGG